MSANLAKILLEDDQNFSERFRNSPITRAKRRGLARNIAVAMGNHGDPGDIPALTRASTDDPDSMVREHAAWALERITRLASESLLD
jgi:epoxyqueuosine reductase